MLKASMGDVGIHLGLGHTGPTLCDTSTLFQVLISFAADKEGNMA